MIKLLLDNKSPLNGTDIDGMTALHHAISEGHGDAAMALLKAGAETDKKNSEGMLAIEMAPDAKVKSSLLRQGRHLILMRNRSATSSCRTRSSRALTLRC